MASQTYESKFREIVSGNRRGFGAGLVRSVLRCLELPYRGAVSLRNRRYDTQPGASHHVGAPVISVGNLTLGGTGKTPMVKWIARWLEQRGLRTVLISRGYGGDGRPNDEARELAQALPDVPHLQNADRVAAARRAIEEFNAQALLLDDAFQHRRIARDLDIVLLDATEPFGYGHVFPRGMLREPVGGLARADVVCLTRANLVDPDRREAIRRQVIELAPKAIWCVAEHAPRTLLDRGGLQSPLSDLAGQRVAGFCGIGNPDAFRSTLVEAGCQIVAWKPLPDHHQLTADDWLALSKAAAAAGADRLVCTHKDLVKIDPGWIGQQRLDAVLVEMHLTKGEQQLTDQLSKVVDRAMSEPPQ